MLFVVSYSLEVSQKPSGQGYVSTRREAAAGRLSPSRRSAAAKSGSAAQISQSEISKAFQCDGSMTMMRGSVISSIA